MTDGSQGRGIKVVDLSKSYGDTVLFENINFEVEQGEFMVIVGPSGCGKSSLMKAVNDRDVKGLGAHLLPVLDTIDYPPSLSPEESAPPTAPVYLLHGLDDTVIPSVETLLLARHLEDKTKVKTLLSALITHAEVDKQVNATSEVFKLVNFWADLLGYARAENDALRAECERLRAAVAGNPLIVPVGHADPGAAMDQHGGELVHAGAVIADRPVDLDGDRGVERQPGHAHDERPVLGLEVRGAPALPREVAPRACEQPGRDRRQRGGPPQSEAPDEGPRLPPGTHHHRASRRATAAGGAADGSGAFEGDDGCNGHLDP